MIIFGYTWEEIKNAQQGKPLGKPVKNYYNICTEDDIKLFIQYGEQGLRDIGFYGVLDRLQRAEIT